MTRVGAATVILAALLLLGCPRRPVEIRPAPEPADLYVLLPGREGKVGALTVTRGGDHRVLDSSYAAARITGSGQLETSVASEEEVRAVFGAALGAQPPRPVSFTVFFRSGTDELTPESEPTIEALRAELARRPAAEVLVIGHTDRVGSVQSNDALSLQRAEKVRAELVRRGVPADSIQVSGRGEREPLVPTDAGVPEPRNRRVEIEIR